MKNAVLKNVTDRFPSSANEIMENSGNEREISIRNTGVKAHKIEI